MMFADRLPLRSLWLGLAVLGGMAAWRCETASLMPAPAAVIQCVEVPAQNFVEAKLGETPDCGAPYGLCASPDMLRARADRLYRARQFDAASRAALGDVNVALDVDLKNLAEQYETLAVAWEVGFDTHNPATNRFLALREAWKLDTVLGGAFTDELYTALRDVAPEAARAFAAAHDPDSARLACETMSALGSR